MGKRAPDDVGIFISDMESTQARDNPQQPFKNHREFIAAEFLKHGFIVVESKFQELRFDMRAVIIHGKKIDGFYIQGVVGQSLLKV